MRKTAETEAFIESAIHISFENCKTHNTRLVYCELTL